MAVIVVLAVAAVVLLFALLLVRRRPSKGIEAHELSSYHDGLDALTRLDARRVRPE